jgi:uncharacterized YigZ family protein
VTNYKSIAGEFHHEPAKIKGSRHIASMLPVDRDTAAMDFVAEMRHRYPTANHHAYAWRLGRDGEAFRYSDDGEPSGSAGRPILQQIDGQGLTEIIVVVSRIFGGTKLGVGGLVRAYGGAAAAALSLAPIVVVVPKTRLRIEYPYACSNGIQAVLHAHEIKILDSEFGADVVQLLEVPEVEGEAICRELRDATAATAKVEILRDSTD